MITDNKIVSVVPSIGNTAIDETGHVYEIDGKRVIREIPRWIEDKYWYTKINGIIFRVDKLLLISFIADFDFPIKYRDNDYRNCVIDNVFYQITDLEFDKSLTYLMINHSGTLFKRYKDTSLYVSMNGAVFSLDKGDFLKIKIRMNDYKQIRYNGKMILLHRMIYETWKGSLDDLYIDHIDACKCNNDLSNLEAVTPSENVLRAFKTGCNKHKWEEGELKLMCALMQYGLDGSTIADIFEIEDAKERRKFTKTLRHLRRGDVHSDISEKYDFSKFPDGKIIKNRLFTDRELILASKLREHGHSLKEIVNLLDAPGAEETLSTNLYRLRRKVS